MSSANIDWLLARRGTVQGWIDNLLPTSPAEHVDRLYRELERIDSQLSSLNVYTDANDSAPPIPFETITRATT